MLQDVALPKFLYSLPVLSVFKIKCSVSDGGCQRLATTHNRTSEPLVCSLLKLEN
jgi:hypothetical protein